MALAAARAAKRGASLSECKKIAEEIRNRAQVFFAVDTLEFLHRGGRIGGASRFLGTALNLKPILYLKDGKIEALERVRTSKKAHDRLIDLIGDNVYGKTPINMMGVVGANAENPPNTIGKIEIRFSPVKSWSPTSALSSVFTPVPVQLGWALLRAWTRSSSNLSNPHPTLLVDQKRLLFSGLFLFSC